MSTSPHGGNVECVVIYDGLHRLGSYICLSGRSFEALDNNGRRLGTFETVTEAAEAIRTAPKEAPAS